MSNELKVSDHLIGAYDITLEDCIKRANSKATTSSYSGTLLDNKDLRRVIFLVNELSRPTEPKTMIAEGLKEMFFKVCKSHSEVVQTVYENDGRINDSYPPMQLEEDIINFMRDNEMIDDFLSICDEVKK